MWANKGLQPQGRDALKVIVLGGTGMLGSLVLETLQEAQGIQVIGTTRAAPPGDAFTWRVLEARQTDASELERILERADWVINCIGLIKHRMTEDDQRDVVPALEVNALFPHSLAEVARRQGCRVLQIATDCVYSGCKGRYLETDPHDALDVYGKTKSLGEVRAPGFHNLRCSIIGPEKRNSLSLLEWFLSQPKGARVRGFTNHRWNGVTTLHFARVCAGIIRSGLELPSLAHLVPADTASKAQMLHAFAVEFGRSDLRIDDCQAPMAIDRTLTTLVPTLNKELWKAGGYLEPPTIAQMIGELAHAMTSNKGKHS